MRRGRVEILDTRLLTEATYKELRDATRNDDRHRRGIEQGYSCKLRGYKDGKLIFSCHSNPTKGHSGKTHKWWTQKVELIDLPELLEDDELSDREKVAYALQGDIRVDCTCPDDTYSGAAYRRQKLNPSATMVKEPIEAPTRKKNIESKALLCKHLDVVLYALPFNVGKITKVLKQNGVFDKDEDEE